MTTPHKYAEVIKKWADGHKVQVRRNWKNDWEDDSVFPSWHPANEYRIKPEPKQDYSKFIGLYEGDGYHIVEGTYTGSDSNVPKIFQDDANIQWDLVNKLELIFDGETKELKDVKIRGKE